VLPPPEPVAEESPPPQAEASVSEGSDEDISVPSWVPESFQGASSGDELEKLQESWPDLVARSEILQPALRKLLRDSWPVRVEDTVLEVGFDPEFASEITEVQALDHGALHRMFSEVLGRSIRLTYSVLKESVKWSHTAPEETETDEGPFSADTAGLDPQAWLKNEKVRQLLEVFHGDILDVQPTLNP
jgi:hypothetical protein